jgi:hypothetical protein
VTDEEDGAVKVGVVDKASGASRLLAPGQVFGAFELVGYDATRDAAVFIYRGERVMVGFSAGPGGAVPVPDRIAASPDASGGAAPRPAVRPPPVIEMGGPPPGRIDLTDVDMERLEPTEDEAAKGIDPKDPATWPEGYRGPTIERLLKKQRETGIEPVAPPAPLVPEASPGTAP